MPEGDAKTSSPEQQTPDEDERPSPGGEERAQAIALKRWIQEQLPLLNQRISDLEGLAEAQTREADEARARTKKLEDQLRARESQLDGFRQELDSVELSYSWRATRPLRALRKAFKRDLATAEATGSAETPPADTTNRPRARRRTLRAARSADGSSPYPEHPSELLPADGLDALESKLVWVLGSPRTGSTWLYRLLSEFPQLATIHEPQIGNHLVPLNSAGERGEHFEAGPRSSDRNYFFAAENARELRPLLRQLVLNGLAVQARALTDGREVEFVMIKEPNGSHASDTIISLLPGSRMIFLSRDGRDVIDSLLDLQQEGSWWNQMRQPYAFGGKANRLRRRQATPAWRISFVSKHAKLWVKNIEATQRAFELLPAERRLMLRYEDLLADTASELARVFEWLGLEAPTEQVATAVEKHAFANIPPEKRGPGKQVRAASPGLWRQTFTAKEKEQMESIMGDRLRSLGYEA